MNHSLRAVSLAVGVMATTTFTAIPFIGQVHLSASRPSALGTPASAQRQIAGSASSQEEVGRAAFQSHCAACHGAEATGGSGPPLVPFVHGDMGLLGIVRRGGSEMPSFSDNEVGDKDVAAIAAYLRSLSSKGQTTASSGRSLEASTREPSAAATAVPILKMTPVTEQMLEHPDPGDWLNWRRTLNGWGYSPLSQINLHNASQLQLAWAWTLNSGTSEPTPLVHDGVMFIPNPNGGVQALNAVTGDLLWAYKKDIESHPPPDLPIYPWSNFDQMRNIAIYGDKIFMATHDAHLMALNARTGKVVWDVTVANYKLGYRYTSGPIIAKKIIVTGMTGCERFKNDVCFITGHDPETGKELWRTSTVARPGEPGGDTWGDLPLIFRAGSDVWIPGTYDPKTNLTYWSTAQAKPWARASRGTDGAALYTSSVLALNPDTGKIVWYHQLIPGETYDQDEVFENILVNHGDHRSLFKMGKLGILWQLDRRTGKFVAAHDLGYQSVGTVDPKKGQFVYKPGAIPKLDVPIDWCGNVRNWPAMSYDPATHAFYVPVRGLSCQTSVFIKMKMVEGGGGRWYGEKTLKSWPNPLSPVKGGQFLAMDMTTGRVLWRQELHQTAPLAALTTGGGLAIIGDEDRYLYVDDAATGTVLYQTRLPEPPQGFPITYAVHGRQYIAVPTASQLGNAIFVFALPNQRRQESH